MLDLPEADATARKADADLRATNPLSYAMAEENAAAQKKVTPDFPTDMSDFEDVV